MEARFPLSGSLMELASSLMIRKPAVPGLARPSHSFLMVVLPQQSSEVVTLEGVFYSGTK